MKILIFNIYYYPDPTGTGLIVTQLAEDLARRGARVKVVTSHPHYGRSAAQRRSRPPLLQRINHHGVEVCRTYAYVPPNPSIFHRALNYLSFTAFSIVAGLAAGRHDIVLWVSPPISTGLAAHFNAFLFRSPVVFDVQDVWPDQVVRVGKIKSKFVIHAAQILARLLYRRAAGIRVLSEGMKNTLLTKGVPKDKMALIPNWVDVEEIVPGPRQNAFRSAHNLNEHFVVLFSGNIGYVAGLETVLEAARELADEPDVLFLIVGEGNAKADLQVYADKLGLSNVHFLTTQPRATLPEMLSAADVCLVPLRRGLGGISVPSKMYTVMASGRPVLAVDEPDSDLSRLVAESRCGMCVRPDDPMALAQAVRALRGSDRLVEMGLSGRRHVVQHFSQDALTGKYYDWLIELASN